MSRPALIRQKLSQAKHYQAILNWREHSGGGKKWTVDYRFLSYDGTEGPTRSEDFTTTEVEAFLLGLRLPRPLFHEGYRPGYMSDTYAHLRTIFHPYISRRARDNNEDYDEVAEMVIDEIAEYIWGGER